MTCGSRDSAVVNPNEAEVRFGWLTSPALGRNRVFPIFTADGDRLRLEVVKTWLVLRVVGNRATHV